MSKNKRTWLTNLVISMLGLVIFGLVVILAAKSKLGYPGIDELNSSAWTGSGPLELSPERARFALIYSLVEDHSFQFSEGVARLATPDLGYKNGRYVSLFAPGTSLVLIPGYLLGAYFGASHLGATLMIGLFALGNAVLINLLVVKLGSARLAGYLAAFVFLVATPAFNYMGVIYQHHLSVFLLLLTMLLSLSKASFVNLGLIFLVFGLSALIDIPNLFFLAAPVLFAMSKSITLAKSRAFLSLSIRPVVIWSSLLILLPVAVYLWINYQSYGNALQLSNTVTHIQALDENGQPVAGRGADSRAKSDIAALETRKRSALNFFKARHLVTGLSSFSISLDRGVLIFTPVIVLGFLGLIPLYRQKHKFVPVLLTVIIFNTLLYSMRSDPYGGWAFGSRYLIPAYAVLAVALGVAISYFKKNVLFLAVFLLLGSYSIYVNTAGALSTSANPPKVEILGLEALSGNRERFSVDRNLEYLVKGSSKSFVYQTFLKGHLTAWEYYRIVALTLNTIFVCLVVTTSARRIR